MNGMQTGGWSKVWAMTVLLAASHAAFSQQAGIDTVAIKALVYEWNFANNTRSVESFLNVYANRLLFYTQNVTEAEAVALKQKVFQTRPGFRQNLASAITFSVFTSGVIKTDFVKEVWERAQWVKYPSYLLISYESNKYLIVGESDYRTDETLNYDLDLGEEMEFHAVEADSAAPTASVNVPPIRQKVDTITEAISRNFDTLIAALPGGMMIVPKKHVYFLIAMLAVGGLMIFVADSVQSRRRRRKKAKIKVRDRADAMVAELKTQSVFEAFVVTLFDPMLFRHRRPEAERVFAGKVSEGQSGPDLEFIYQHQEVTSRFAVKCLYFPDALSRRWQLMPPDQFEVMRSFESESQTDLYYVIGIGGTPDDPKELYLLPAQAVKGNIATRETLRPYAKSGMFYYHKKSGALR